MGTVPELAREVLGAGFVVDVEAAAAPGKDLAARLGAIPGVMTRASRPATSITG